MPIKPDNMPWITPYLTVKDADKAVEFYQEAFAFELANEPEQDDNGHIIHAELKYNTSLIMVDLEGACVFNTAKPPITSKIESPVGLYVYYANVDQQFQHALACGAKEIMEPQDMPWGDRIAKLSDLDEHSWIFATQIQT